MVMMVIEAALVPSSVITPDGVTEFNLLGDSVSRLDFMKKSRINLQIRLLHHEIFFTGSRIPA